MATTAKTTPADKKPAPTLTQRIHSQLTTGALKQKLTAADLDLLSKHIDRLKAILV